MEAWEGVCSRVWSAGAKREREPGEEEEEGFYGVPEHPLNQVKLPAARELDPLCGNRAAPPKWLLASNPTPGCRSDVFPMKGGAQPLDLHHTLIQAFSQLLTFWPVLCGHRTVRIGRQLREKKACGLEIHFGLGVALLFGGDLWIRGLCLSLFFSSYPEGILQAAERNTMES